jgi:outer membrane protein
MTTKQNEVTVKTGPLVGLNRKSMAAIKPSLQLMLAAALLVGATAQAQETKIGFVNTERIFRDAPLSIKAQKKLEQEFSKRDQELQKMAKQARDLQAVLDKEGVTMAESARRDKERELANLSRDLQRSQREFREDLNLRKNEELGQIQQKARKVIQELAEREKFDLVLEGGVVYINPKLDITEKVLKLLDK